MENSEIRSIIEALLFVTDRPLAVQAIRDTLGDAAPEASVIEQSVEEIARDYDERDSPMEVRAVAGGWQFATRREYAGWVRRLFKEKTTFRLSNSALETLSVIAYKQPITRAEIEEIRGVEVSMDTLLERKLVKVVGRKETIGRPLLYGTTPEFLKHFGLTHLSELPSLDSISIDDEPGAEDDGGDAVEEEVIEGADLDAAYDPGEGAGGGEGEASDGEAVLPLRLEDGGPVEGCSEPPVSGDVPAPAEEQRDGVSVEDGKPAEDGRATDEDDRQAPVADTGPAGGEAAAVADGQDVVSGSPDDGVPSDIPELDSRGDAPDEGAETECGPVTEEDVLADAGAGDDGEYELPGGDAEVSPEEIAFVPESAVPEDGTPSDRDDEDELRGAPGQ